jgi:hypothetical protein
MKPIFDKYEMISMISPHEKQGFKPILFGHRKLSSNADSGIVAEQIFKIIESILHKGVNPDDIAVLMPSLRNISLFPKLTTLIKESYGDICHAQTSSEECNNSFDWIAGIGKIKMLSIHSDKGKGHKYVILVGITDGSLPKLQNVNKETIIVDESLLYVALTRCITKLYIGVCHNSPSRFIIDECKPYAKIHRLSLPIAPSPVHFKTKDRILNVTKIVADIEISEETLSEICEYDYNVISCGKVIPHEFDDKYAILIGRMAELALQMQFPYGQRLLCKLRDTDYIFVNNTFIIEMARDTKTMNIYNLKKYFELNKYFELKDGRLAYDTIRTSRESIIISESFKPIVQKLQYMDFNNLTNEELFECNLLHCHIHDSDYNHNLIFMIGHYPIGINVKQLKDNINIMVDGEGLNDSAIASAISFEKEISFSTEIAEVIGIPHIEGFIDIYNKESGTLYEIKAGKPALNKWKMQTFLYAAMLKYSRLNICKIVIVNLLEGIKYIFDIKLIKPLSALKLICDHYYDAEIYRKFLHKYEPNRRLTIEEVEEETGDLYLRVNGEPIHVITYKANIDLTNDQIKKFCDGKSVQMFEDGSVGTLCINCDYNIGCRTGKRSEIGKPVNMYDPDELECYAKRDIEFIGIARVFRIIWYSGEYAYYNYVDNISSDDGISSDDDSQ